MRKRFKLVKRIEHASLANKENPGNLYRNIFGDFFVSTGDGWVGLRASDTRLTDLFDQVSKIYDGLEKLLDWGDIELEVEIGANSAVTARITNYWFHMSGFSTSKTLDKKITSKLYKRLPDFGIF